MPQISPQNLSRYSTGYNISNLVMIITFKKIAVFAFVLFIAACSTELPKNETVEDTLPAEIPAAMEEDIPFVLPSPLQIASIFKKSGLTYVGNITNPVANVTKYSSRLSKSLNFGVYAADLSYCVLNNQSQAGLEYMKVIRQLSDELGISSIINSESLFKSFEKNIGVEDSMIAILSNIQEQLDAHLQENNQEYMSAVYFVGGWVEAMYLGSKLVKEKKKLSYRLVEQMTILDMLVNGLSMNPNKSAELDKLIEDLKAVKLTYDNFESVKKLQEKPDANLEDFAINDDDLGVIISKVQEIRTYIING